MIAAILAKAVNATHAFGSGTSLIDDMDADIERIRPLATSKFYTPRVSVRSRIKQLLHCNQIPESLLQKVPRSASC